MTRRELYVMQKIKIGLSGPVLQAMVSICNKLLPSKTARMNVAIYRHILNVVPEKRDKRKRTSG